MQASSKGTARLSLDVTEAHFTLFLCFFVLGVTGELSTLRQLMKVPNEPGLSPNKGLENVSLSDQSTASNPRKGQAKCPGNTSGKTSSLQGSCSPAYSQACSFSTNKASPLSESTPHSCQDHKYIEVPGKASSRQDSCSPSIRQAGFFPLDKRQAHA